MARSSYRNGLFEYGTIYDIIDLQTNQIGDPIGRLIVDPDTNSFWQHTDGMPAKRLSEDTVKTLIARDAIVFDHDDSREKLLNFLYKQEEKQRAQRERELSNYRNQRHAETMDSERKIVKKTRRNAAIARLTWVVGCMVMVCVAVFLSIPDPEPSPALESIAGEGMSYDVDASLLEDVTYISVLGSGSEVYGIIMDNEVTESGSSTSSASVKENVMIALNVSLDYPLHMRPLYYESSSFYQSMIVLNDYNGGSSGIYLQNPDGYYVGVPANELVLTGGQGLSTIVLSSPEASEEDDASSAARTLESDRSQDDEEETYPSELTEGWLGYDSADIDNNLVVASYYYTKNNTQRSADLRRRVIVHDITSVYSSGSDGVGSISSIQLNYADLDSNYYDPVVALSDSSNGNVYWIGYMQADADGENAAFYIRRYETVTDILEETTTNTYSTSDITGNDYPITNYTLYGDLLFYEQRGYIWVTDLSRITVTIDGTNRIVSRVNPVAICSASDIRSVVTGDDSFKASAMGTSTTPTADYKVMQITTTEGVEYGIAFVEADTGDLVFQSCSDTTVTSSSGGEDEDTDDEATSSEVNADDSTEASLLMLTHITTEQTSSSSFTLATVADSGSDDTDDGRILIRAVGDDMQIVCFNVRGEQVYWVEENVAEETRTLRVSPVYYRNDAQEAILSASEAEDADNGDGDSASNTADDGSTLAARVEDTENATAEEDGGGADDTSGSDGGDDETNASDTSADTASTDGSTSTDETTVTE